MMTQRPTIDAQHRRRTEDGDTPSSSAERTLVVRAPAKINWVLDLLDRRADGYHELETVASCITLADEVTLAATASSPSITLTCTDASLPTDEANLAFRAAVVLARRAGVRAGASIHLKKRVPVGAGLGGGSSDAAAVLRGLNALWGLDWPIARLLPLAAALGSDVPLLLAGGTGIARGRGEFVEPVRFSWPGVIVVAMPGLYVSTRDVYADVRPDDLRVVSHAGKAFADGQSASRWSACDLLSRCRNGLEAAAFRRFPDLREWSQRLCGRFDRAWRLCGSGSSFFTAWDDEAEAEVCVRIIRTEMGIRAEPARLADVDA